MEVKDEEAIKNDKNYRMDNDDLGMACKGEMTGREMRSVGAVISIFCV